MCALLKLLPICLLFMIASHELEASNFSVKKIIQTNIENSYLENFAPVEEALDCLMLDFMALVFMNIIDLESTIGHEKTRLVGYILHDLNAAEFRQSYTERFRNVSAASLHPLANSTIREFRALLFNCFKPQFDDLFISENILELSNRELKNYLRLLVIKLASKENLLGITLFWQRRDQKTQDKKDTYSCPVQ